MAILSLVLVVTRLLARHLGTARLPWGWDDVFVLVTWVFTSALAVVAGFLSHYGIGKDIWYFRLKYLPSFFLLTYIDGICYAMATSFVKIVLLAFYLKVFPSQGFQRASWGMIYLIISWMVAFTLVVIFQCKPVKFAWQRWDLQHKGTCINYSAFVLTQSSDQPDL